MTNTTPNNPVSSGAVIEREEGHMNDAKLLNAFINDPSALAQFAAHLLDAIKTKLGWSDDDVNPVTFGEMTDDQLLSHLSEFLGSGVINTTINGGFIEQAQENVAFNNLSEEELAEVEGASDPRVIAAKLRKAGVEAAKDAAEREQERRMEERRAEWDAEMHDFGGERLSGTEIMRRIDWYNKPENKQRIRDDLKKQGLNDQQIKDIEKDVERRNALLLLMRDKKSTPEQEEEYKRLNNSSGVRASDESVSKNRAADVDASKERDNQFNVIRQTESVPNQEIVSTDTSVAKPVAEKSAAYQDFPSAEGIEIRKNFAGAAAANTNTPVAVPAPVVVAKAELKVAATADMAF